MYGRVRSWACAQRSFDWERDVEHGILFRFDSESCHMTLPHDGPWWTRCFDDAYVWPRRLRVAPLQMEAHGQASQGPGLPAADFLAAAGFTPADLRAAVPRWWACCSAVAGERRRALQWLSTLRTLATLDREWSDAAAPCLHAVHRVVRANLTSCVQCARPCYRGARWCRGCMRVWYCCPACQRDAWHAGHRQTCYGRPSQGAAVTIQRAWRRLLPVNMLEEVD